MTVEQLFQKLSSKEFKDTENGDLFYLNSATLL